MCGISGFFTDLPTNLDSLPVLKRMAKALTHRGPDQIGVWSNQNETVGFAHSRLSVVELSEAGRQPMISESGNIAICFNGEIYNHLWIRERLHSEGICHLNSYRGGSDTETLLVAIEAYGVEATLEMLQGMFAFAIWDDQKQTLTLVRDRAGEKPLYYGNIGRHFVFSSELSAIRSFNGFKSEVCPDAASLFMRFGYVPTPYSIYKNISKLPAGCILKVNKSNFQSDQKPTSYWRIDEVVQHGLANPFKGSFEQATNELEEVLQSVLKQQMIADVPIGAFLSGGIDSSLIVALMTSISSRKVSTFTIGFEDKKYDEAPQALAVAQHLGTDHSELYLTEKAITDTIIKMPSVYDEPFADSSQIPTYLVSKFAREKVTVCLSGDAGDELFGGYNRHVQIPRIWNRKRRIPHEAVCALATLALAIPPKHLDYFSGVTNVRLLGDKLHKLAIACRAKSVSDMYGRIISQWQAEEIVVNGSNASQQWQPNQWISGITHESAMMHQDFVGYLSDDILVKVDRAAMANSLETRVPFLDQRVINFAWALPMAMKIQNGKGKIILRAILNKYVPKELTDRPKFGFGIPLHNLMRGPLREWCESLLSKDSIEKHGLLDFKLVNRKWKQHLSRRFNWQHQLWNAISIQAWLENESSSHCN